MGKTGGRFPVKTPLHISNPRPVLIRRPAESMRVFKLLRHTVTVVPAPGPDKETVTYNFLGTRAAPHVCRGFFHWESPTGFPPSEVHNSSDVSRTGFEFLARLKSLLYDSLHVTCCTHDTCASGALCMIHSSKHKSPVLYACGF